MNFPAAVGVFMYDGGVRPDRDATTVSPCHWRNPVHGPSRRHQHPASFVWEGQPMSLDAGPTRRSLLGVSAAACSACVLAACAPSTGGSGQSSAGGSSPSAGSPAPVASGGTPVQVLKLADIAVGDSASGEANGQKVLVYRPAEKTVEAYSAICTHQGCTVAPAGAEFHCPCHGSVYSAQDGTVLDGPAPKPLPRFATAIEGDWITVTV